MLPKRFIFGLCAIICGGGLAAAEFHVATGGNDSTGDGTAGNPYRTITRALTAVVDGRGDTVTIHGGTYRETVRIVKSGQSAGNPLRVRAASGETVIISGLDPVSSWSVHSGSIYKATVNWSMEDGNTSIDADKRAFVRDQLFVDGLPQVYARWPNIPVAKAREITTADLAQMDSGSGQLGNPNYVSDTQAWFTDAALGSSGLSSATIAGSLISYLPGTKCFARTGRLSAWNGTTATVLAERLHASDSRSASSFAGQYDYLHAGCDYHLWGKYAYLDAPGEWFRDPGTNQLYAWMPDGGNPSTRTVELRKRNFAITVDDAYPGTGAYSWIEISGLRVIGGTIHVAKNCTGVVFRDLDCRYLTHANDLRAHEYLARWPWVFILNGTNCSILDSEFIGLEYGIEVNGRNNALRNCVFDDMGASGIPVAVYSNIGSESATNDGSQSQRNVIEQCTFLGSSFSAIALNAGTNVLANEVVATHRQGNDIGAITCAPGTDCKGIEVAWNSVHDLYPQVRDISNASTGGPGIFYGAHGIYFDHDTANALVHHNVVWNTSSAGIAMLSSNAGGRRAWANTVNGKMVISTANTNTEAKDCLAERIVDEGENVLANGSSAMIAGNLHYLNASPGWIDSAGGDYRIGPSSPAIDAGVVLAAVAGTSFTGSYAGSAPDAGAWEGTTAWSRAPGAVVTTAQLAAVTVTLVSSTGSVATAQIGGLPRGRHLPSGSRLKIGSAAAGGVFVNRLDPATGNYTVTVKDIPVTGSGSQGVQLSTDGGTTWSNRGTVNVDPMAIDRITGGGTAGFNAAGGEAFTLLGHGFTPTTPVTWQRSITIANPAASEVFSYPVPVVIDTASLITAGKLQADGRDLRFSTAADGELPYWIESGLNTATTTVWVRIPRVPAGGLSLALSYGDASRTARSDAETVFYYYEGFTGLSTLPADFSPSASAVVAGGKVVIAGTTTSGNAFGTFGFSFASTFTYPASGSYLIESKMAVASPTLSGWKGAFGSSDGAIGINNGQVAYYSGGWNNLGATTVIIGTPTRVGLAVDPGASALRWYENDVLKATRTGVGRPAINWVIGPNGSPKDYRLEVDEIRIRPFIPNGPNATVGSETTIPAQVYSLTIDGVSVAVTRVDNRTMTGTTPPAPAGVLPRSAVVSLSSTNPVQTATSSLTWITTPVQTTGVTLVGGTRQVSASWTSTPSAVTYTVRWGVSGGALTGSTTGVTGTAAVITGLSDGIVYDVTVEAVNHVGVGQASARASAITIPGAPTAVNGVVGDRAVGISWTRPTGTATSTVRWGTASGSYPNTVSGIVGSTITIAPLTNGAPIYLVVTATNAAGTGPASAQFTITPTAPTAAPASAPGGATAVAGNGRIDVSWSPVASAAGYIVRWGPAGGALTNSGATTGLTYAITGLTNGVAYEVTIEAQNSFGSGPATARMNRTPTSGAPPIGGGGGGAGGGGGGGGGGGCGAGTGLALALLGWIAFASGRSRSIRS